MESWETEDERHAFTDVALPTPAETPRRTLSRTSRKSRRSVTPPMPSSSPPRLPEPKPERRSRGMSKDKLKGEEQISALDPRRFTPTLHANLVSEILALRRDQEDKLKIIETLELSLQESREEQEALQASALQTAKEGRSLKRQLALLEGGTSSALGELARERDEAVDAITDTRKRLEVAQKKVRAQEEDSERVHQLWSQEKDEWEEERRKYERKLHIADSRLKLVLEEVANMQKVQDDGGASASAERHGEEADGTNKDHDAGSVRTNSLTSSVRFSMMSGPGKVLGHSLADELNFDDDEDWQTDPDGRQSVLSHFGHNRTFSRDSVMSRTHHRNQSHDSPVRPGSVARRGRMYANPAVLERLQGGILEAAEELEAAPKVQYMDTGIQYSPPPSPEVRPAQPSTPEPVQLPALADMESPARNDAEVEANQSRKRVYVSRPASAGPMPPSPPKSKMVSLGTQTLAESAVARMISPTPARAAPAPPPPVPERKAPKPRPMQSTATQTDAVPVEQPAQTSEASIRPILSIPSISIIPPTSRAASPEERRLPQYVKDFGCQVSLSTTVDCSSTATQTDEIRVDQRLDRLPLHLHPSTISSRPTSPAATNPAMVEEADSFTPSPNPVPPRNPKRLTTKRSFTQEMPSSPPDSPYLDMETHDSYPGNNDNGPLSTENALLRRPPRISSLFAGFEASSDDGEDFKDADLSDAEFQTALSAPRHTNSRQSQRSPPPPSSPEQAQMRRGAAASIATLTSPEVYSSYSLNGEAREVSKAKPSLKLSTKPGEKPSIGLSGSRMSVMRKAAMIQNGIATHQNRTRSPSLTDTQDPPFPIPTRASSRRPPNSFIAPSDGQHSPTRAGQSYNRRTHRSVPSRNGSLRKVRSAAQLPRYGRGRRQGSRSPPPMSPSDDALESPGLPPLPSNDLTSSRRDPYNRYKTNHRSRPSTNTANTTITEDTNVQSVGSSQQASSVVDAIAQTMVGEWMFKYVRRRKSFGMGDVKTGTEENSNDRHRRWVWLAPYERAILWSSKQPVSGNALMGKPGRKLVIQSVLDVKDDNPAPKGFTQIFNRSILILTPQRALKFTATSAERHYLWLTALSFLAHSQQAVPEILPSTNGPAPPPTMGGAPAFELNKPKAKRGGIRDSIRLTKGKNPTMMTRNGENKTIVSPLGEGFAYSENHFVPQVPHQRELSKEAAEPPFIPRFHERGQERVHERANQVMLHGRKRSNTGGHIPPPISFRGFSGPSTGSYHTTNSSIAGNSVGTAGSSDIYQSQASSGPTWAMSQIGSQRTSEASSRPPTNNFFEALGTVRMEAFISPLAFPRFEEHPNESEEWRYRARRRSKEIRRNRSRSRTRRDSYTSRGTRNTESVYGGSRTTADDDYFRSDPFRGF
ncbi:uncharacterized protein B0I36DRAFT_247993 [Microdochium trichocladiopsis]|uniref:Pleckstrin homology domain-containing protein n=1 Tax=Microdochium trichocladiopsis TaxID=1682393 RepID=A0A9P8Y1I2_9PEZI|nr:uncharacterized protein B0I36DRAFT_247993 [Microdochium trichocladiopsis]KAH7025859.1 hypothetical protein B0I36DRAFT_247993 [Microdochium trichocladiopsis]